MGGSYAMLKGKPCKVVDYSTSKTGKHGHAKAHIIGIDIFTGKKCEDLCPTSHNMLVPIVTKNIYTLMDVGENGELSLLTYGGDPKDDLNLCSGTDELEKVAKEIKQMFEDGKGVRVTTISASARRWLSAARRTTSERVLVLIRARIGGRRLGCDFVHWSDPTVSLLT